MASVSHTARKGQSPQRRLRARRCRLTGLCCLGPRSVPGPAARRRAAPTRLDDALLPLLPDGPGSLLPPLLPRDALLQHADRSAQPSRTWVMRVGGTRPPRSGAAGGARLSPWETSSDGVVRGSLPPQAFCGTPSCGSVPGAWPPIRWPGVCTRWAS